MQTYHNDEYHFVQIPGKMKTSGVIVLMVCACLAKVSMQAPAPPPTVYDQVSIIAGNVQEAVQEGDVGSLPFSLCQRFIQIIQATFAMQIIATCGNKALLTY